MYKFLYSFQSKNPSNIELIKVIASEFKEVRSLRPVKLNAEELESALEIHHMTGQWTTDTYNSSLRRQFKFSSFQESFSFMNQVALICEQMEHFPTWRNINNQVSVELSTNALEGITMKDILLAYAMENICMEVKIGSVDGICDTRKLITSTILNNWNNNYSKADEYIQSFQRVVAQI